MDPQVHFLDLRYMLDAKAETGKKTGMDGFSDARIDPYALLVRNPDTTFFLQAGADMPEWGIGRGDMLVADSSAEAADGKKVIAELDGELRLMALSRGDDRVWLSADGRELDITGREHVYIRGVLMWVLREM